MDLIFISIAEIAIYSVTFAASYDFWRESAGKCVFNVLWAESYQSDISRFTVVWTWPPKGAKTRRMLCRMQEAGIRL